MFSSTLESEPQICWASTPRRQISHRMKGMAPEPTCLAMTRTAIMWLWMKGDGVDIQPKYLTFAELVSKRLFRIPEYQRAYSWKSKHRQDLFDDISKLKSKPAGSTHFMATVVGLQRERETIHTDEYTRLDIVDGQQRLTTLILLCKAIEKALSEADKTEVALRNEIASLLVKNEAGTLLLL